MKYLITGFPGMGKSTIAQELKHRGHIAYDPQAMRTFMHVESQQTGKHIHPPEILPHNWYETTAVYNWDPVKIEKLLNQSGDIFICSLAHNQTDFYDSFNIIFVLTLDSTELEQRLRSRAGKAIGKNQTELTDILSTHEHFEQSLLNHGAVRINASKPMSLIVDEILSHAADYTKLA